MSAMLTSLFGIPLKCGDSRIQVRSAERRAVVQTGKGDFGRLFYCKLNPSLCWLRAGVSALLHATRA
jgi:hypothetical protein